MNMNFKVSLLVSFTIWLFVEIIKSGEKLLNAYIYAVFDESFDLDSELFNVQRLEKSFDTENSSSKIVFDHSDKIVHQNATNRRKTITATNVGNKPATTINKPANSHVIQQNQQ